MLSRRVLLQSLLGGVSSAALTANFAGLRAAAEPSPQGASLTALLERFFDEDIARDPEAATFFGLDKGPLAAQKFRLRDRSPAGAQADLAADQDQLRRLQTIDRRGLDGLDAVNFDCVAYVLNQAVTERKSFDFGSPNEGSPYVVSQLTGAYAAIPTFLDSKHAISNAADADAYLARLEAFATALDQDSAAFSHDVGKGVCPANFLLETTLGQLTALQTKPEESTLVASIARRTKDIAGHYAEDAARLYREKVSPALDRQISAVRAAKDKAGGDAGVWHIPQGAEWYHQGLQISTTTTLSPDEIHKIGLDRAKRLSSEIDRILKQQGLSKGSVAERIKALGDDPGQYYGEDDASKAQAITDLQTRLDQVVALLPRYFHDLPKAKVVVQRVPKIIEAGQALAYYESAALDGSRPGTIYFNFAQSREWPKWALPTTLYHEGMPGHHLQGAIAQETPGLPRYRANMFLSGYGEGWALYAEQLADELGVYAQEPLGRLGYLKEQLFRAGRLVVDTGLHHQRWSRDKAIAYMVDLIGDARSGMTREVDRYCVWPGQACSYLIGFTEWDRLRAKAKSALGDKFDIRDFHKAGLDAGVMPLDLLARVIDGYIKARLG